jgi:hypothetical protein
MQTQIFGTRGVKTTLIAREIDNRDNGGDAMSQQSSNGNQWTLNLSSELQARTEALRKDGQSHRDVMEQVFKLGLYQLEYRNDPKAAAARKAYREKLNEQNKIGRQLLKQASTDPELAVKLGLGTRVAL